MQCGIRKVKTQMKKKLTRKKKEQSPGFLEELCQRKKSQENP